ncbi:MAG: SUMF1/EgtB/PvdO family nonheme iron enzyme [bacterium]|nr:SUMF1/EgtB/PvdO family nonheme iron enzyme [bacterium]
MTDLIEQQISHSELVHAQTAPDEIQISTPQLLEGNVLRFNIHWVGAWHSGGERPFWDAAWVFVKAAYHDALPENLIWQQVQVATDKGAHSPPAGCLLTPAEDGMGVFVRLAPADNPETMLVGKVDGEVRLKVDLPARPVHFQILALRMVYQPTGPFWAGNPDPTVSGAFHDACRIQRKEDNLAYLVDSENEIEVVGKVGPCGDGDKRLIYSPYGGDRVGPIPAAFPKGYRGFYIMRSHLTQGQYADFINALVGALKTFRYPYSDGAYRFTIKRGRHDKRIPVRPRRPCNYMSWADGTAYCAWAGLRPMTELELEKACSWYPKPPVSGMYAWGNTNIAMAQIIQGWGGQELVVGNCNAANRNVIFEGGDGGQGPVRDDGFSLHGGHSAIARFTGLATGEEYGGTATGVLGMSGNLWDLCVNVSSPEGRRFVGNHGQGALDAGSAPADLGWPRDHGGYGYKGGSWYTETPMCRVADRSSATALDGRYTYRSHDTGFRAARSAPPGD